MLIFLALIIGLIINYLTGGFNFNQNLCIIAGLFLIMPSLLNFHFKDLLYFKKHKKIFFVNLFFNFILNPIIFLLIGYIFFGNNPIIFSFLLLGLIPGGGLLMSWVMNTKGNIKLAFSLFLVNLFIFSIIFIGYANFLDNLGKKTIKEKINISTITKTKVYKLNNIKQKENGCMISNISKNLNCPVLGDIQTSKSAFIALFILIIFPFIISRFILFSKKLTNFLLPKVKIISKIATFFIIAYIFSIKEVHNIFSTDILLISKIFFGVLFSYFLVYISSYFIYKKIKDKANAKSLFWNISTRFLTLGLIFSFFYINTFKIDFLLVFVLAYFIQIIASNLIFIKMNK